MKSQNYVMLASSRERDGSRAHSGASPLASLTSVRAARLAGLFVLFLGAPALAGGISGKVTDRASGSGLAGIGIHLYDQQGKRLHKPEAKTDPSGAFVLEGVPAGTYRVKADAPKPPRSYYVDGYWAGTSGRSVASKKAAVAVSVADAGPLVSGIEIGLELGGTIAGKIVRSKGHVPLADIDLDLYSAEGERLSFDGRSDAAGHYVLGPVPAGRYVLRADPGKETGLARQYFDRKRHKATATSISVTAGAEASGKDFVLKAKRSGREKQQ